MLGFVARSSNLSSLTKATSQTVSLGVKPLLPPVAVLGEKTIVPPGSQPMTNSSLAASLPTKAITTSFSIGGKYFCHQNRLQNKLYSLESLKVGLILIWDCNLSTQPGPLRPLRHPGSRFLCISAQGCFG